MIPLEQIPHNQHYRHQPQHGVKSKRIIQKLGNRILVNLGLYGGQPLGRVGIGPAALGLAVSSVGEMTHVNSHEGPNDEYHDDEGQVQE